jgi:hypothetical protein
MRTSFFALLLLVSNLLNAQISKVTQLARSSTQYTKSEWDISLTGQWNNPYLQQEVTLDMIITSPSGKKLVLPCYYVSGKAGGNSGWKARFTPQEAGKYSYSFALSEKGKQTSTTKPATFQSEPSLKNGILHAKNNWTFQYDNGKPFRGIGENIGWESRANDDSKFFKALHEKPKYNYEEMLPLLAKHGGNYFRTWIYSFNLPIDWKSGFNSNRYTETTEYFNPSAIAKLDRMIELSDSLGLHVMLTLGQGAYRTRDGGFATSGADFFVNPLAKQQYRDRLRYFVARWGYSPAIGAWEFFNEVDNVQFANNASPINADSIVQWHDEMSTYLKQIDPYHHLVTTSISHRDLKGLNALKNIDFNQKHIYKNTKGIPSTIVKYEADFNKPYVIGEFGYEWDWSKDFNLFASEMDSDFKRGLWYGLFSPTPILPLSWWWEYFDDRKTDEYFNRVKTISNRMLEAGKGDFKPALATASDTSVETHSVTCGSQTFSYFFNPSESAKKIDLEISGLASAPLKIELYDCETGKIRVFNDAKLLGNKLMINAREFAAKSDVIFIVTTRNAVR